VRKVEREGQQSEYETKLLSKVTPWSARSVRTLGITRIDSTAWSSVINTTTFGRLTAREALWASPDASPAAVAIPAASAAKTIHRIEAAIEVSLPRRRERFVRTL